jgi:hypothetical protein
MTVAVAVSSVVTADLAISLPPVFYSYAGDESVGVKQLGRIVNTLKGRI